MFRCMYSNLMIKFKKIIKNSRFNFFRNSLVVKHSKTMVRLLGQLADSTWRLFSISVTRSNAGLGQTSYALKLLTFS